MFNYDEGIAQIAHFLKTGNQAIIIALMLAYKLEKNYDGMIRDMENKGMLKQAD